MKRILTALFALVACSALAATTSYYVDPDYTGGSNDGSSAHPWTGAGSINWTTVNTSLGSGPVNIYFSALKANGIAQQSASANIHPARTDSSANRLTIDGYSFYNINTTTPSWQANPFPQSTAYTNKQVFNLGGNQLGWARADALSASVVTVGGTNFQCIHSHVSSAGTQPPVAAGYSNFWSYLKYTPNPANGVYSTASPGAWSSGVAYVAPSRQDNVTLTGFEANGGFGGYLGDNLIVQFCYFHDYSGGQPGQTILYTSDSNAQFPIAAPCTNLLLHDFRINNTSGEGTYVGAVNPDASAVFQVAQSNQMNGLTITNFWIDNCAVTGGQGDGIDEKNGILNVTIQNGVIGLGVNRQGGIIVAQTQTPSVSQNQLIDSVDIHGTQPGGSEGEAIYMNSSTISGGVKGYNGVTIRNCTLNNNNIGIYNVNGGGPITNIQVYNCSVRNSTNSPGITISAQDNGISQFKNNVCWLNNGNGAQASITAGVTSGNNAYGVGGGPGGTVAGVVDSDFVGAAAGNFRYPSASVREVDQGATIGSFNYDKDGNPRPSGPAWDIGAFEFQYAVRQTNFYASPTGSGNNTGISTNSPWPLGYALSHAGASNTIFLMDGTYTQPPLTISSPWQTLKALNKWKPIISKVTSNYSITAPRGNGAGTTIDGLQFSSNQFTLEIIGTNCTLRNLWLHHTGVGYPAAQAASGVECGFSSGVLVEDCLAEYNGADTGFNHGIYGGGTNQIIRNNVCRYNQGYGIIIDSHVVTGDKNCQIYQNLIYSNITGNAVLDQLALYNDAAVAPSSGLWTNHFWGNTILSQGSYAVILQDGTIFLTNNIILSTSLGVHRFANMSSDVIKGDYTVTPQALEFGGGSHDVISSTANFVSLSTGLYWLAATSPARGVALAGVFGPVDFFGNTQASVSDIGFIQYTAGLTADARVLDPSPAAGADYWTNITGGGTAPTITSQPVGAAIQVSQNFSLTVGVSGTPPFSFQWLHGASVVQNGSNPTYFKGNAQLTDAGSYTCVITNVFGTVTSIAATVTVTNPATPIIGINPGSLNFGLVATSTVTPLSFTVINVGNGTLTGTATTTAPYSILSGGTFSLAQNASQVVTVNYTPTAPEQDIGTVFLTNSAIGGSTNVALLGTAYTIQNPTNMSMNAATILQSFILSGGTIYQNYDSQGVAQGSIAYLGFSTPNNWTNQVLYVNVEATNVSNNSYWLNIDAFPTDPANIFDITNITAAGLQLYPMGWRTDPNVEGGGTNVWNLGQGVHVVNIVGRESNCRLGTLQFIQQSQTYPVPPIITVQPQTQTILSGNPVTFTVGATGTLPLAYQWNWNGTNISGANQTSYSILSCLPANDGLYGCTVTNIAGSTPSFAATLVVTDSVPTNVRIHFHGKKH